MSSLAKKIRNSLARRILRATLAKVCPSKIPLSGEEAQRNDCYSVWIKTSDSNKSLFRARNLVLNGVEGFFSDGNSTNLPGCIPDYFLGDAHIEIVHYYGSYTTKYEGISDYILGTILLTSPRFRIWNSTAGLFFNAFTRFEDNRVVVLEKILTYELKRTESEDYHSYLNDDQYLSELTLFSRIYGARIFGHPRYEAEFRRFRFFIEASLQTNDLNAQNGNVKLSGKALDTIREYREGKRRHREMLWVTLALVFLTLVLAVAASVEALKALQII